MDWLCVDLQADGSRRVNLPADGTSTRVVLVTFNVPVAPSISRNRELLSQRLPNKTGSPLPGCPRAKW